MFLVRKMHTSPALRRFKAGVVTDRKDLQRQLSETATLSGEAVEVGGSAAAVRELLRRKGPGLVFATIQKTGHQHPNPDTAGEPGLQRGDMPAGWRKDTAEPDPPPYPSGTPSDELLNDDEAILVLVDEAHRSQAGDLHARLLAGLPNCARIGFTGTPIIMGERKRTHEIFGEFIDRYSISESVADGATVPVLYEGRTASGAVRDGASLDQLFDDLFRQRSAEELEAIKQKYATRGPIFDAPLLIADKARDMLRHYVTNILPNGYKAQLVAYSRLAAVRYVAALEHARDQLLQQAAALPAEDQTLDDEALCRRPPPVQALIQAWRYRDTLARIEFAAVISASNNDDPAWAHWTNSAANEQRVQRFKKPLLERRVAGRETSTGDTDPLAFLVVKSMLLTGFDAPIEGVMYLDRPIREAELLQAIARVNRTGFGKRCGIVVDYYGVARHLQEALAAYADEDIHGALQSLNDEIPALRDRHQRVMDLLRGHDIDTSQDIEAAIELLADERLRAEFSVKLKQFLASLELVLPRPEGLPFTADAKALAYIHARARNRYRDTPVIGKDVGAKVRRLIDEHVISLGIDPTIPPVALTDATFDMVMMREPNDRARASEMEHAIRSHIRKHLDEDPVRYRKLSERLDQILKTLAGQWEQITDSLQQLVSELRRGIHPDDDTTPGDLPAHYGPFLRLLLDALSANGKPDAERLTKAQDLTVELVDLISDALMPGFWEPSKLSAQDGLGTRLFSALYKSRLLPLDHIAALKDKLLELARANHDKLSDL